MQRAVIVMLIGIGATIFGCGPTELQRRACDMYVDAGGRAEPDLAYWVKFFNAPRAGPSPASINGCSRFKVTERY